LEGGEVVEVAGGREGLIDGEVRITVGFEMGGEVARLREGRAVG